MSESKPRRSPRKSSSHRLSARRRSRERRDRLWFFLSLTLHALGFVLLVYLTPVREIVRQVVQKTKPQATMSGGEIERLADAIEVRAADQILENTRELRRVLGEMAKVYRSIGGEFQSFEQKQRRDAPEDAVREMEAALQNMEEAAEAIEGGAPIEAIDRYQALAEQAQQRARKKLDMLGFDVSEPIERQQHAEQVHQEAKQLHDQRRRQSEQVAQREQQISNERSQVQQWQERLSNAKERQEEKQVRNLTNRVEREQQQVDELVATLGEEIEQHEELKEQSAQKQRLAAAAQREALDELQETVEARRERGAGVTTGGEADSGAEGGRLPMPPFFAAAGQELEEPGPEEEVDVAALYEQARSTEDDVAEALKEIRAMDLAMVRDIELAEARDDIDLMRPVRPELNYELLRASVRTGQRFEAHKEEVGKALRETTSMVNLARRMLEMANQSAAKMKFGADAPMPEGMELERPELELIIRELAMEDVSGRYSNMADMMQFMGQQQEGSEQTGQQMEAGAGMMPRQDIKDLTREVPPDGEEFMLGGGEGEGDLPQLTPDVPAVGARRIEPDGQPGKWMYLDTWYTIGPFPNPNRVNIDREFPPDSIVDLDATYIGKGGRTIRWRFTQSETPQIVPPNAEEYGIWYAYTELYSDRPRDVWVATGTDDRGILKVNGVPVWISSKRLKGWDIDEVWRRIHLKEGINRILYRVENGWLYIGFSLVIRLEE